MEKGRIVKLTQVKIPDQVALKMNKKCGHVGITWFDGKSFYFGCEECNTCQIVSIEW